MAQLRNTVRPKTRLSFVVFTLWLALVGIACDDFYSDSLPTPPVAQPTPIMLGADGQSVDAEDAVENGARAALAARLGIGIDSPRKILLEDATWTERNPGCYPLPSGVSGPYLVPGYRLLMQYEGVFYEYDADLGGQTGALCDSTVQHVPVEPAFDIVSTAPTASTPQNIGAVYVLRSENDVSEFNSSSSSIALVAAEVVDWTSEVLVGGWLETTADSEAVRAYRDPAEPPDISVSSPISTHIVIEVGLPEDQLENQGDDTSTSLMQIWALVDITETDSTYEFRAPE